MNSKRQRHTHTTSLRPEGQAPSRAEIDILRQKVVDLVSQKPDEAATILSDWLNNRAAKKPPQKKAG